MKPRPHIRREKKYTEAGLRQTKGEKVYEKTCLTVRHVFRQIDMEFSLWYNRDNKSGICGGEQYAMLLIKNLETPRLTIRSWQKSDKDFTLSLWGDKENGKYMSDPIRENMDEA